MPIPTNFIQIDEEGFAVSREIRVTDPFVGQEILSNLKIHEGGTLLSSFAETPVIVEAFDEPYIAQQIFLTGNKEWVVALPYGLEYKFSLHTLSLDEWDRFHGYTNSDIPFVMSRKAQSSFFHLIEDYGDDFIVQNGEEIDIPSYWPSEKQVESEQFWSQIYESDPNPGWNLGAPAEALKDMLPRLKIARSRVLVLGCGEGHDAAHFAQAGHLVTAVDISTTAIDKAKKLYGHLENITFLKADIFNLPRDFDQSFDIIFEHTCYCAINPIKRSDLVKVWNRVLAPGGYLMGVFFTFEKRKGPPFGGSEWELRQRLKSSYQPIFWGRWQKSVTQRQGKELFVYCRKT